jgi:hypothetical protein
MATFKLFGAAVVLSVLAASPASAQHMIDEPGMFAFYHPMGDLGIASTPTRPPVDARAMASMRMMQSPMVVKRAKSRSK